MACFLLVLLIPIYFLYVNHNFPYYLIILFLIFFYYYYHHLLACYVMYLYEPDTFTLKRVILISEMWINKLIFTTTLTTHRTRVLRSVFFAFFPTADFRANESRLLEVYVLSQEVCL